jgi:hypothetical protein
VSDAPEILVGFSTHGFLGATPPSDWTLTFWLHDENDKFQRLERREVLRGGDRYFTVALPGGQVARCRQHHESGAVEWVQTVLTTSGGQLVVSSDHSRPPKRDQEPGSE